MSVRRPICPKCRHNKHVKLRRNRVQNGAFQCGWYCTEHDRFVSDNGRLWLPKMEVLRIMQPFGRGLDDVPFIEAGDNDVIYCIVCDNPHIEWHHIAPQHLAAQFAPDWQDWPVIPLCKRHHKQWHDILTPNMSRGGSK